MDFNTVLPWVGETAPPGCTWLSKNPMGRGHTWFTKASCSTSRTVFCIAIFSTSLSDMCCPVGILPAAPVDLRAAIGDSRRFVRSDGPPEGCGPAEASPRGVAFRMRMRRESRLAFPGRVFRLRVHAARASGSQPSLNSASARLK